MELSDEASQLDKVQRPALIEFESHKRAFLMNGYHGFYSGISQRHISLDKGADEGRGGEVLYLRQFYRGIYLNEMPSILHVYNPVTRIPARIPALQRAGMKATSLVWKFY